MNKDEESVTKKNCKESRTRLDDVAMKNEEAYSIFSPANKAKKLHTKPE